MIQPQDESPKSKGEFVFEKQGNPDPIYTNRKKEGSYGSAITAANLPPASHGQDTRPAKESRYAPVGSLEFFGIFLLMLIPVVNIVLLLVWAFGGCKKINKRNFARAYLVMLVLFIGLGFWGFSAAKSFYHDAFVEGNLTPDSQGANLVQSLRQKAADLLLDDMAKQLADSASSPAGTSSTHGVDLSIIASLAMAQDREGLRELGLSDDVIDGLLAAAKDPALLARYLSQATKP